MIAITTSNSIRVKPRRRKGMMCTLRRIGMNVLETGQFRKHPDSYQRLLQNRKHPTSVSNSIVNPDKGPRDRRRARPSCRKAAGTSRGCEWPCRGAESPASCCSANDWNSGSAGRPPLQELQSLSVNWPHRLDPKFQIPLEPRTHTTGERNTPPHTVPHLPSPTDIRSQDLGRAAIDRHSLPSRIDRSTGACSRQCLSPISILCGRTRPCSPRASVC